MTPAGARPLLEASDVPASDAKASQALARYTFELVSDPASASFDAAYRMLWAEFGAKGELERRDVVEAWLRRPAAEQTYRLVVARDAGGGVAGVRDFHVAIDRDANVCVVYLAHVIVAPSERRGGLGGLMRHLPAATGRRALAEASLRDADVLLAAEMEPFAEGATDTLVRLVAYGKAGYKVMDPARVPYAQPDFRAHADIDADPRGALALPLLAVVRWLGHEDAREAPVRLARAYVSTLYAIFATHCRARDYEPVLKRSLDALAAGGDAPIALLPPPTGADDAAALAPLARARVVG